MVVGWWCRLVMTRSISTVVLATAAHSVTVRSWSYTHS
jgi:hypothetical protein